MTARRTLNVDEAAAQLGISRNACYDAIRRGELPHIRLGHRVVIPLAAFERMLAAGEEPKLDPHQAVETNPGPPAA